MDIIIASGNLFCRELSAFILTEAGYTVHEATDSDELLQHMRYYPTSIILLDIRLIQTEPINADRFIGYIQNYPTLPFMLIANEQEGMLPLASEKQHVLRRDFQSEELLAEVRLVEHRQKGMYASAA
jgi:DNA-binding response OmpR family regulator